MDGILTMLKQATIGILMLVIGPLSVKELGGMNRIKNVGPLKIMIWIIRCAMLKMCCWE